MRNGHAHESMLPFRAFLEAHAVVVGAIERELQLTVGLPLTWYEVLYRLASAPDASLRMQDLAERLVFSRSGVTRLIDRLGRAGLVERASCPSDRRGMYAVLTDSGRSTYERARPAVERAVEEHFARHLDAAEAAGLTSMMARIIAANVGCEEADRRTRDG